MLADHGHPQIRAIAAAILTWPAKAQMPGSIGTTAGLPKQRFPFRSRQTVVVPICSAVLATMIEEALVVILRLQRFDVSLDETVQLGQVFDEIGGQGKIHITYPSGDARAQLGNLNSSVDRLEASPVWSRADVRILPESRAPSHQMQELQPARCSARPMSLCGRAALAGASVLRLRRWCRAQVGGA